MADGSSIVKSGVSVVVCAAGLAYWWLATTRWYERFRRYCERRCGVTIELRGRSSWVVTGTASRWRRFWIGQLPMVYWLAIFLGHCGAMALVATLLFA